MEVMDYVNIAFSFMVVGAVLGCIVILIGYVLRGVFRLMEGGK